MLVLCCHIKTTLSLSDVADISQVIIAIANLFLAGYVLIYQILKDKKTDNETARLNEQNIKLQWLKIKIYFKTYINKVNVAKNSAG